MLKLGISNTFKTLCDVGDWEDIYTTGAVLPCRYSSWSIATVSLGAHNYRFNELVFQIIFQHDSKRNCSAVVFHNVRLLSGT